MVKVSQSLFAILQLAHLRDCRFFEECGLKIRNIKLDCIGEGGVRYIEVFLERRKGWQSKRNFDAHSECFAL
jgi:hypothetical protein